MNQGSNYGYQQGGSSPLSNLMGMMKIYNQAVNSDEGDPSNPNTAMSRRLQKQGQGQISPFQSSSSGGGGNGLGGLLSMAAMLI